MMSENDQVIDWDEASELFEEERSKRKTVEFEYKDKLLKFEIKQLTQAESDKIEENAIEIKQTRQGEARTEVNTSKVKNMAIKFGVSNGPEGFNPKNTKHIEKLPNNIRNDLADSIQNFSELDEEVRISFR